MIDTGAKIDESCRGNTGADVSAQTAHLHEGAKIRPFKAVAWVVLCAGIAACAPESAETTAAAETSPQVGNPAEPPEAPRFEHRDWVPAGGPAAQPASTATNACAQQVAERSAFFGDLHVHTSLSLDAFTRGGFQSPDDAYRFAKGEAIGLAPTDTDGQPMRFVRIDRPLDFAAVTDHAEWIGELESCRNPASPAFGNMDCRMLRGDLPATVEQRAELISRFQFGRQRRPDGICGADARVCREYAGRAWQRIQTAAAAHQDRTDRCAFTTFNAWEYSAMPGFSKVHRNVILRNDSVPELPISWLEDEAPEGLWQKLKSRCNDTDTGCEAITIPHNPNISSGRLFTVTYKDLSMADQRRRAELQASLEPLVEMMQSKGESECRMGMYGVIGGEDELCGFEKVRYTPAGERPDDCEESFGSGAFLRAGCQSRLDFARYGLIEGLREYARIGVNPYQLGFIGSTDTHNATPGATEEYDYFGHNSNVDDTIEKRLTEDAYAPHPLRNPGGLMGVWAVENSRDALFDAMKRRETFATSGVRIKPRLFAGWDLPDNLCEDPNALAVAYQAGVPMGGALQAPESTPTAISMRAPMFFANAIRDPGSDKYAGTGLQRIQLIKGEVDTSGAFRETIIDVAVDDGPAAEVDADCNATREGAGSLCAVWRDPQFNPDTPAVYYARVLEQPSCRWSTRQCLALPADERPAACSAGNLPRTIQERAWTSAIWYHPRQEMR